MFIKKHIFGLNLDEIVHFAVFPCYYGPQIVKTETVNNKVCLFGESFQSKSNMTFNAGENHF